MSAAEQRPALDTYRDAVEDMITAGERFGDVEDAIDGVDCLTLNQKAALWLYAFSLRDRDEQRRDARSLLAALG